MDALGVAELPQVGNDMQEPRMPDFERLNDTTDATIRGMWHAPPCCTQLSISAHVCNFAAWRYHTEYLFRRACEYAMTQGVEAWRRLPTAWKGFLYL